jgi:dTDP-3-amino-3,4,6-trideoxy-alpha-D-glucose transaminase
VYHLYVARTPRRDALQAHLRAHGVDTGIHFPVPVHRQPAYAGRSPRADLTVTETCAAEVLSLPMYPELGDDQTAHVTDAVREFFG